MSSPTRVLLVGVGARGKKWARILHDEPQARTVGYVDIADENLQWSQSMYEADPKVCYKDMEKALKDLKPDMVVLVTPPTDRYRQVMSIFEHGSHLLSEKPLSLDLREGIKMVKAAQKAKLGFAVGLNFRFQHCVMKAREILSSGEIGAPKVGGYTYWRYRDAYTPGLNRFPITMREPMLYDQAIHHLDEIRFVYDAEVDTVWCRAYNPPWSQYNDNATAVVHMQMTKGIEVHYFGTWAGQTRLKDQFLWRTDCENGALFQYEFFSDLRIVRGKDSNKMEPIKLPEQERLVDDARIMLTGILTKLQKKDLSLEPSAIDHLKTFALMSACEESSNTGQPVKMSEFYDKQGVPREWL
ncbi:MAG: Gfo/Idh/MocA family oxidoreductase [SAR202 cluster bacterium]|nr:Gfo/Idh/MocA family oxidoreductase [SAR202 cluster bacterium]